MRKFIHSICLCLTICAITMAQTNGAIETEQVPTRNTSNRFSIPGIGRLAFSVFALLNCADALITNGHPIKPVGIFNPTNRLGDSRADFAPLNSALIREISSPKSSKTLVLRNDGSEEFSENFPRGFGKPPCKRRVLQSFDRTFCRTIDHYRIHDRCEKARVQLQNLKSHRSSALEKFYNPREIAELKYIYAKCENTLRTPFYIHFSVLDPIEVRDRDCIIYNFWDILSFDVPCNVQSEVSEVLKFLPYNTLKDHQFISSSRYISKATIDETLIWTKLAILLLAKESAQVRLPHRKF